MHKAVGQVPEAVTEVKTQVPDFFAKILLSTRQVDWQEDGGVFKKVLKQHPGRDLKLQTDFRHDRQCRVQFFKLIAYDDSLAFMCQGRAIEFIREPAYVEIVRKNRKWLKQVNGHTGQGLAKIIIKAVTKEVTLRKTLKGVIGQLLARIPGFTSVDDGIPNDTAGNDDIREFLDFQCESFILIARLKQQKPHDKDRPILQFRRRVLTDPDRIPP